MIRETDALRFACEQHAEQTRKGHRPEPFVLHPLRVARRLLAHDLDDPELISAALLHDVLEDTDCPPEEIEQRFGPEVLHIVRELTDDKELLKSLRKQYQVERANLLGLKARLIRIADKTDNVADLVEDPPAGWSLHRRRDYVAWARRVVDRIRGTHPGLEDEFDHTAQRVWNHLTGSP